jgi:hypothetical protein
VVIVGLIVQDGMEVLVNVGVSVRAGLGEGVPRVYSGEFLVAASIVMALMVRIAAAVFA